MVLIYPFSNPAGSVCSGFIGVLVIGWRQFGKCCQPVFDDFHIGQYRGAFPYRGGAQLDGSDLVESFLGIRDATGIGG